MIDIKLQGHAKQFNVHGNSVNELQIQRGYTCFLEVLHFNFQFLDTYFLEREPILSNALYTLDIMKLCYPRVKTTAFDCGTLTAMRVSPFSEVNMVTLTRF